MTERRATYRTNTRARRVDSNQAEIIAALEALGCRVIDTSGVGAGFPDLTVIRPDGSVCLVEVKTPTGGIKPAQLELMLYMVNSNYRIFSTPEQAAANITAWG
jgi:hypothetical protein